MVNIIAWLAGTSAELQLTVSLKGNILIIKNPALLGKNSF